MSSMRNIADAAGVSLSTVSAVLSGSSKYVSDDIRQKVLRTANELKYSLKERKNDPCKNVIVLMNGNRIAMTSSGLDLFKEAVEDEKTNLCCYSVGHNYESEKRYLRTLQKKQIRAVVDFTMCPPNQLEEYCNWIRHEFVSIGIPFLIAGKKIDTPGIISVSVDNGLIGYEATMHLLRKGHKKIVCLLGRNGSSSSTERYHGYCRAMREYGLYVDPNLVVNGDYSWESGENCLRLLLQGDLTFTAVFSVNDDMAIGAIKAIKESGKRVPEDIAIIGVDGTYASQIVTPTLSTIEIPVMHHWQIIAECIQKSIEEENTAQYYNVRHNLIERESTDFLVNNSNNILQK